MEGNKKIKYLKLNQQAVWLSCFDFFSLIPSIDSIRAVTFNRLGYEIGNKFDLRLHFYKCTSFGKIGPTAQTKNAFCANGCQIERLSIKNRNCEKWT